MKIAYFGYDFFASCLDYLSSKHEVVKVFSYETDQKYNFNDQINHLVAKLPIALQLHRVTESDVRRLEDDGCELLIAAAYPYKIPVSNTIKGINIHPSLLPEGKGRWPLPHVILKKLDKTGVSIHKLTDDFDSGDILLQAAFDVSYRENLESLSCKTQLLAVDLLKKTLTNFDQFWLNAKPQGVGSYWPFPSAADQTLKWNETVVEIDRVVRAYGKLECIAYFDDKAWVVRDAIVWQTSHKHKPGEVVHRTNNEIVIAASDGLVCLRDYERDYDNN